MDNYTVTELLFLALGVVGSAALVLATGIGIVYIFGGKEVKEQIKREW